MKEYLLTYDEIQILQKQRMRVWRADSKVLLWETEITMKIIRYCSPRKWIDHECTHKHGVVVICVSLFLCLSSSQRNRGMSLNTYLHSFKRTLMSWAALSCCPSPWAGRHSRPWPLCCPRWCAGGAPPLTRYTLRTCSGWSAVLARQSCGANDTVHQRSVERGTTVYSVSW